MSVLLLSMLLKGDCRESYAALEDDVHKCHVGKK
jgi:hypothetical protein